MYRGVSTCPSKISQTVLSVRLVLGRTLFSRVEGACAFFVYLLTFT